MRPGEVSHNLKEMDVAQHNPDFQTSWKLHNLPIEANNVFEHWCYFKDFSKRTPLLRDDRLKEPKPCIILGSGSGLNLAAPLLKDWKGGIICSSSQLTTLAYHGAVPTYWASPDPRFHMEELEAMPEECRQRLWDKTTFIQTPIGPIEYTLDWQGRIRWFLILDPGKEWYANAIAPNFLWIPETLLPFSSNAPALVALANYLGYAPLYLCGVDFAGYRADIWQYIDGEWKEGKGSDAEGSIGWQKNYLGQMTDMNLEWAWRGMLCTLRLGLDELKGKYWHVYNCGPDSALKEQLPYRDIKKVVETQGEGERMEWSKNKLRQGYDLGLARFNTFTFRVHNGQEWGNRIEMANSWEELGAKIDAINNTLDMQINLYNSIHEEDKANVRKEFKVENIRKVDKQKALDYCGFLKAKI